MEKGNFKSFYKCWKCWSLLRPTIKIDKNRYVLNLRKQKYNFMLPLCLDIF